MDEKEAGLQKVIAALRASGISPEKSFEALMRENIDENGRIVPDEGDFEAIDTAGFGALTPEQRYGYASVLKTLRTIEETKKAE